MTDQQLTELQGPFSRQFRGLDLSNSAKSVGPDKAQVFHNCDVSPDGGVVRRGGTAAVSVLDLGASSTFLATETLRTKADSNYIIYVTSTGVNATLVEDRADLNRPAILGQVSKSLWTQAPSSVCFVATTAPYDRLLLLTPEHPIVQLSFLERTVSATCTAVNGSDQATFAGPALSVNDTTLWNDTTPGNYLVSYNGVVLTTVSKSAGFNLQLQGTPGLFTAGQNYTLVVRQITWQWWAESEYQEGANMMQQVSRSNITEADQNVKVPEALLTDFQPFYKNSQNIGLYAFSSPNLTTNTYTGPIANPSTENQYGFSNGGRYISAAGATLQVAPFFCTFGAKQAGTAVGQVGFVRLRPLRFNGGIGSLPQDLRLFVDNSQFNWASALNQVDSFNTWFTTYTVSDQVFNLRTVNNLNSNFWGVQGPSMNLPASGPLHLTSVFGASYFSGGQNLWYRSSPANLDGTYVRVYGLYKFVDYSKRNFHKLGILYRDRLILVNPETAQDQLAISEVADFTVGGEFYQYFQVTDALGGLVTDPFTINVTNDSREQITAIAGWQSDIFVFTTTNTYSISGGEQFGESSYKVDLVSTYGAFNQNCVVVSNLTVLYMNRFGVFDLLNKPNTDQYGAVERSQSVRTLFNSELATDQFSRVHWMRYNEATNKLYCGLALKTDTNTCSRILSLNMTWDSWSTMSSVKPFQMYPPVTVFRYTLFMALVSGSRYVSTLCADMPFHLDFAIFVTNASYPYSVTLPTPTFSVASDNRGILQMPIPPTPGLSDYSVPNASKVLDAYVRSDGAAASNTVTAKNPMQDFPTTLQLVGGSPTDSHVVVVTQNTTEPYVGYGSVSSNANPAPSNQQVNTVNGFINRPLAAGGLSFVGVNYPSIYASPRFDLDSLGRLKRLRRLHLMFDTTVTEELFYPLYNHCRVLNACFVSLVYNYREYQASAVVELLNQTLQLDGAEYDTPIEVRQQFQKSLSLAGYGCDYQFYITSVGSEAFKLSAYEFEVQPQRDKRYQTR